MPQRMWPLIDRKELKQKTKSKYYENNAISIESVVAIVAVVTIFYVRYEQ